MRLLAILMLFLLIATQSNCGEKFTYPVLKDVSEIEVMDWDKTVKKISDPLTISKIVEFINRRREGWATPITGFPETKVKLHLYQDGEFLGHFGMAETSFSMQRGGRWDSRPASTQEVQELLNMIGIDKALLK